MGIHEILEIDIRTEIIRVRFPSLSLHISIADLLCLAEGELLNGTIIDFYLNHIRCHLIQDPNLRMHIFPSLFWGNLKSWFRTLNLDGVEGLTMTGIGSTDGVSNPSRIQYWLEDEDIFDADFLVIPVNEYNHWSLTIISMSCLTMQLSISEPLVIIFDSQQSVELPCTEDIVNILKTFLLRASELSARKENLQTKKIKTVIPKNLPQQENDVDCGLYILEYAQRFLLQPPIKDLMLYGEFDFTSHYPDFNITSKRRSIRNALSTLCADSSRWSQFFDVEQCDTVLDWK
uniref:ULP_PROTEASE domain-containing protein n=1 Tax=Elaeophora elaphi TaxID=1147741 RepID=A0A0R3RGF8_9BILA